MEGIQKEYDRLNGKSNLVKSISSIDHCLSALIKARDAIQADPSSVSTVMGDVEKVVKKDMEKTNDNLKEIYSGLTKYTKALDKKFKSSTTSLGEYDILSAQDSLIDRAIAMHLIREGQFKVAETFIQEAKITTLPSQLQTEFESMYRIKEAMKNKDLLPAIEWAAGKRALLEARGSNLEFELHRLMFVHLFTEGPDGPHKALIYGRRQFVPFQKKYLADITKLIGALAFVGNIQESPYAELFNSKNSWAAVSTSFTREFCSLLHLSAESPLYVAVTAGTIALPTLMKMSSIMKEKRTEWTSRNELPVEIPLLPKYQYHSIFVCPVSKEQTTEENPPMMLPCGHVVAQESLSRLSKGGTRFKCPYCPTESLPKDAKRVYL